MNEYQKAELIIDGKILSFVKEKILPMFTDAEIVDFGDRISPRYGVVAPFEKNNDIVDEPGYYGWFSTDGSDDQIKAEYEALWRECKEFGKEHHIYHRTIHDAIAIYGPEK